MRVSPSLPHSLLTVVSVGTDLGAQEFGVRAGLKEMRQDGKTASCHSPNALFQTQEAQAAELGNARVHLPGQKGTDGGTAPMATAETSPEGLEGDRMGNHCLSGRPAAAIPCGAHSCRHIPVLLELGMVWPWQGWVAVLCPPGSLSPARPCPTTEHSSALRRGWAVMSPH